MECLSFCIANSIDLTRLDSHHKTVADGFHSIKLRDLLKLTHKKHGTMIFVFKNGTVVTWGLKRHQVGEPLEIIKRYANKTIPFRVHDEFSYLYGEKISIEPHDYFDVDCITLDSDSDEIKLSLSYGFSQSVKLQYFETILESLIEKYTPLIHELSSEGRLIAPPQQIRQIIGEILGAKSEMNLISNFLYHPKFFWQHPTLEDYYTMLEKYLHIQRRVNAINHRLNTLGEIFDMFNDYLESRHTNKLEVIVIILIALEVIFGALHFYF